VPLPLRSSTIAFRNLGWSRFRRTSTRSRPPRRPGCPHRKPLCTRSGFRSGCRLTAEQILLLSQLGSVQAHTASNARLSGFDYKGQLAEIAENKAYLEAITGQPVHFLAWPFGDRNDSAGQAASAARIPGAFGLGGIAASLLAIDPYHIPRIMMGPGDDLPTFAAKVGGW
jgi:hypothetical protein